MKSAMKAHHLLMALLLSAIAVPVTASEAVEGQSIFPAFKVAQLSPEERRTLREHWERASPEDRLELRRQYQDRMQATPQQEREPRRLQQRDGWAVRMPTPPNPAEFAREMTPFSGNFGGNFNGNFGGNFGSGYEQRRPETTSQDEYPPAGRYRR